MVLQMDLKKDIGNHLGPCSHHASALQPAPAMGLGLAMGREGFELLSACLFQLTTELIEPHRSVRGHSPICRHGQAAFLQLLIDLGSRFGHQRHASPHIRSYVAEITQ